MPHHRRKGQGPIRLSPPNLYTADFWTRALGDASAAAGHDCDHADGHQLYGVMYDAHLYVCETVLTAPTLMSIGFHGRPDL